MFMLRKPSLERAVDHALRYGGKSQIDDDRSALEIGSVLAACYHGRIDDQQPLAIFIKGENGREAGVTLGSRPIQVDGGPIQASNWSFYSAAMLFVAVAIVSSGLIVI